NGDATPKRILSGPDTLIAGTPAVAADPVRNLLVVNLNNAFLIFDRTAQGNTKPKAIIRGPRSQVSSMDNFVISPKGIIVGKCLGEAICARNIAVIRDVPCTNCFAQALADNDAFRRVLGRSNLCMEHHG